MIGDGRRKSRVEKAKELKLDNITWLPFQDLDTLHDSLQCSHLSLVSKKRGTGIMVPINSTVYWHQKELFSSSTTRFQVAMTIQEQQCGVVLDNDDPKQLAQCLKNSILIPKRSSKCSSAGLAYGASFFSPSRSGV